MKPHLHFMGIGGISMSGLARWYAADGHPISGCDSSLNDNVERLRREGISVMVGHAAEHLEDVDTLVHSMAVRADHPEVARARTQGLRVLKRIDLLGELFERRKAVAVTGTHGKSTTSGMLATVFVKAGIDPSVQLGATLPLLEGVMRYGAGDYLVAEVDESDPGFAQLKAHIAVLTNLEDDHIAGEYKERRNYHASLADLEAAAQTFARRAEHVVYCVDWPGLQSLVGSGKGSVSYGFAETADYRIGGAIFEAGSSTFVLTTPGKERIEVALPIPGRYNVQNAAAALCAAHLAGLDLSTAAEALSSFTGVGRRWQRWGTVQGALIIDDYAHHPTEVRVTLKAAQNTGRRVRAVLQPHRWVRTARHWRALADAAGLADEIIVLDIYAAGEAELPEVSPQLIVERLRAAGKTASYHTAESAGAYLGGSAQDNDLIITLGAGDVWKVAAALASSQLPVEAKV